MYTHLNSLSLLDAFPTISSGSPPNSWWILGAYRYWTMEEPGATVPMAAIVLAVVPPTSNDVGYHVLALSEGLVIRSGDVTPYRVEIGVMHWR